MAVTGGKRNKESALSGRSEREKTPSNLSPLQAGFYSLVESFPFADVKT
jgi:hypothetical protein